SSSASARTLPQYCDGTATQCGGTGPGCDSQDIVGKAAPRLGGHLTATIGPPKRRCDVVSNVSRFVVSGGPLRSARMTPTGNVIPPSARAAVGRSMPTVKEPPVECAGPTIARQPDIPGPACARTMRATVIIGCTPCRLRYLR